ASKKSSYISPFRKLILGCALYKYFKNRINPSISKNKSLTTSFEVGDASKNAANFLFIDDSQTIFQLKSPVLPVVLNEKSISLSRGFNLSYRIWPFSVRIKSNALDIPVCLKSNKSFISMSAWSLYFVCL